MDFVSLYRRGDKSSRPLKSALILRGDTSFNIPWAGFYERRYYWSLCSYCRNICFCWGLYERNLHPFASFSAAVAAAPSGDKPQGCEECPRPKKVRACSLSFPLSPTLIAVIAGCPPPSFTSRMLDAGFRRQCPSRSATLPHYRSLSKTNLSSR